MTLGEKIKELRSEKNWTRQKLAENAKVSLSVINRVETEIQYPSINALIKIAKALNKDIVIQFIEKD